jgi:hypothetical protein
MAQTLTYFASMKDDFMAIYKTTEAKSVDWKSIDTAAADQIVAFCKKHDLALRMQLPVHFDA